MKIIQTFWSGSKEIDSPLEITAGWISPEYHWMSWALSCLLLRQFYDHVELFTDEIGKKVLIDILQLPYTDVHVVFDNKFVIHPKLFSLAKIHTYSLQQEPFIHIDGDVFLWKRFSDSLLNAELISSNLEKDLFFNEDILREVNQEFDFIPEHLKGVYERDTIFASNAGIFGGSNIEFIKHYCKEANNIIESNKIKLDSVNTGALNFLIEQISLFYLSEQEKISTTYYVRRPVTHPLYQDYLRFIDVPDVPMVHPVGGCKKLTYVLLHLAKRLRLEFPNYYYKILVLMKANDIDLHTRLYNFLNVDEKREIHSALSLPVSFDDKIQELTKTDFQNSFERTIKGIEYYFSQTVLNHNQLYEFIGKEGTPLQLKEIYELEKQSQEKLISLIHGIKEKHFYEDDCEKYLKYSAFHFNNGWMDKEVGYDENVTILDLKWNWELFIQEPTKEIFDEFMKSEASEFCITLSPEPLCISIHETYHDGIDKIVLKCMKGKRRIKEIAIETSSFFENDITIENIQFQQLVFDTIKRLAQSRIINLT